MNTDLTNFKEDPSGSGERWGQNSFGANALGCNIVESAREGHGGYPGPGGSPRVTLREPIFIPPNFPTWLR